MTSFTHFFIDVHLLFLLLLLILIIIIYTLQSFSSDIRLDKNILDLFFLEHAIFQQFIFTLVYKVFLDRRDH